MKTGHNQQQATSRRQSRRQRGVSLVEVLVAVFVLSMISISLYGVFLLAGKLTIDAKLRTVGVYLANEEMEKIKAMSYAKIGTAGGVPDGSIEQLRVINQGGYDFEVKTEVKYLDDETDGLFPSDTVPADYKSVRLEVSWPSDFNDKEIVLVSSIYPESLGEEEAGAVLSINAVDFEAQGVDQVEVEIHEPNLDPPVSIYTQTDEYGNVSLYGMPESLQGYEIKLSRAGYETVMTYPEYPLSAFSPVDSHMVAVAGNLNTKTIRIDELAQIELDFVDEAGEGVAGLAVAVTGGRIIGYTEETNPQPVYNFDEEELAANAGGELQLEEVSGGNYSLVIQDEDFELVRIDPDNPFEVPPGVTATEVKVTVAEKTLDSLLTEIKDEGTGEPFADVAVEVTGPNDFVQTENTDERGKAFFWKEGMENGDYTIVIDIEDYERYEETVAVEELTIQEIFLSSTTE